MNEDLGSYLRRVRKEKALTLRDVEKKTGISNAYLSQLENNRIGSPSPTILHNLAECYRISYERLMKLTGYPVYEEGQKPAFRSSTDDLENLTPEEKEKVMEYIQFLKSRRRQ
jgi:transcriptional regulator with XRE-family HTH domain